ncbi:MAG: hypothetical protein V1894_04240 [Chloroflexota bacterium]
MAGYEFSFLVKETCREQARSLLRAFQLLGKEHDLEVRYKSRASGEHIKFEASVHGSLQSMQIVENRLYELMEGKYRFERYTANSRDAKRFIKEVYLPIVRANEDALTGVTEFIEWTAKKVGGTMGGAVATLQMREHLMDSGETALCEVIKAWDDARTKLFRNENDSSYNIKQPILLDQAVEAYLKHRLGIDKRVDFTDLTTLAVESNIIHKKEKLEIDSFHVKRNKSQHENKPLSDTDLYDYLVLLSQVLRRICSLQRQRDTLT